MASRFIEDGGDVTALQQILGHASISLTMQYVSLAGNHSLKEHAAHSPARRFAPDRSKLPTLPPASGITTVTDDGVVLAPADYGELVVDDPSDPFECTTGVDSEYWDGFHAGYRKVLDDFADISTALDEDGDPVDVRTLGKMALAGIHHLLERLDELDGRYTP